MSHQEFYWLQEPLQAPVVPNQFQGPMTPVTPMWILELHAQVAARDATIAELRRSILALERDEAISVLTTSLEAALTDNERLDVQIAELRAEIALMTLAANAWREIPNPDDPALVLRALRP